MLTTLAFTNNELLQQCSGLIESLDETVYAGAIGPHMRHILEFYECFLNGLEGQVIDYDARQRDVRVERSRSVAQQRIQGIQQTLSSLTTGWALAVRMEDGEGFMDSSVERELQVLASHTTHHCALISLLLRGQGIVVAPKFGVAKSTLRYRAQNPEAALCAQ